MKKEMNKEERIKMVKAMEYIVRQINNEGLIMGWLMCGVADGDIEYGDLEVKADEYDTAEDYIDNETLSELMAFFLCKMVQALNNGGLYCDGVVSEDFERF